MPHRRVASWLFCCFYSITYLAVLSLEGDTLSPSNILKDGDFLSSSDETFEMGFFSPGASKNRYLGIWYTKSDEVVVWVANRNNPISDRDGFVTVDKTGNLTIWNGTQSVIWSSNVTTSLVNPVAQLLESGNLILKGNSTTSVRDSGYTIFWQSFDYPTDTMLPDMKIGWNLKTGVERYMTSWNSLDDPSSGKFTYRLQLDVLPQLVLASESAIRFRTGPWKGSFFDGLPGYNDYKIVKLMITNNRNEIYTSGEPVNSNVISRTTLNGSGYLEQYVMYDHNERWHRIYWSPFDVCDIYAQCGINGICTSDKLRPCKCLKGFQRNISQVDFDANIWNSNTKCVRITALNCPKGEGFLRVKNVKLPDMKNIRWNQSMGSHECEAACLRNCSCVAYANLNVNGSGKGCMMWFGDLVDIKYQTVGMTGPQDLYVRVPHSELVNHSKKTLWIVLSVAIICTVLLIIIFCFIRYRKTMKEANISGSQNRMDEIEVPLFDFCFVDKATDSFAEENVIGNGGFGVVFKGKFSSGVDIAVKRLSRYSGQGIEEFRNEAALIGKLQHRNLVSLLGICIRGEERMLIYEYMSNKSLDYFLFDKKETKVLTWKERFDIVMGIARGLLYLHQDSKLHVVHRDLKAANILLGSSMNPKISDFGIARIFGDDANPGITRRIIGTYGYMSPEYASDGNFSVKSDVFSFGVIILEIVSSKKNRGFSHSDHSQNLLGHAWLLWMERKALELLDPNLHSIVSTSEALRCIHVGLLCVQRHPTDRPDMSTVVFMLANEGIELPQPKQPGFFVIEEDSLVTNSSTEVDTESHHTVNSCSITIPEPR